MPAGSVEVFKKARVEAELEDPQTSDFIRKVGPRILRVLPGHATEDDYRQALGMAADGLAHEDETVLRFSRNILNELWVGDKVEDFSRMLPDGNKRPLNIVMAEPGMWGKVHGLVKGEGIQNSVTKASDDDVSFIIERSVASDIRKRENGQWLSLYRDDDSPGWAILRKLDRQVEPRERVNLGDRPRPYAPYRWYREYLARVRVHMAMRGVRLTRGSGGRRGAAEIRSALGMAADDVMVMDTPFDGRRRHGVDMHDRMFWNLFFSATRDDDVEEAMRGGAAELYARVLSLRPDLPEASAEAELEFGVRFNSYGIYEGDSEWERQKRAYGVAHAGVHGKPPPVLRRLHERMVKARGLLEADGLTDATLAALHVRFSDVMYVALGMVPLAPRADYSPDDYLGPPAKLYTSALIHLPGGKVRLHVRFLDTMGSAFSFALEALDGGTGLREVYAKRGWPTATLTFEVEAPSMRLVKVEATPGPRPAYFLDMGRNDWVATRAFPSAVAHACCEAMTMMKCDRLEIARGVSHEFAPPHEIELSRKDRAAFVTVMNALQRHKNLYGWKDLGVDYDGELPTVDLAYREETWYSKRKVKGPVFGKLIRPREGNAMNRLFELTVPKDKDEVSLTRAENKGSYVKEGPAVVGMVKGVECDPNGNFVLARPRKLGEILRRYHSWWRRWVSKASPPYMTLEGVPVKLDLGRFRQGTGGGSVKVLVSKPGGTEEERVFHGMKPQEVVEVKSWLARASRAAARGKPLPPVKGLPQGFAKGFAAKVGAVK